MKNLLLYITLYSILLTSCSESKRLIRRAEVATGRMQYQEALAYYDKALTKDNDSYRANAGKGMLLSEFMERYDLAIPNLEKALALSPKDTLMRIHYNLGKGYHYIGNYNKALYYYSRVSSSVKPGKADYDPYYPKRIADCNYALQHPDTATIKHKIKNAGRTINSEYPEYAPVLAGNKLFFTSRRKDDKKEKINAWDGKYFESIYTSTIRDSVFTSPERYTIPDLAENSTFQKHNEAVVSVSPDDRKMFVYRDGKIYESSVSNPATDATLMDRTINFARFQNHASVSGNGNILYFTSESRSGNGDTDIYRSVKDEDGKWREPELLDTSIVNTPFDEEAPFFDENGVLYFSSNGLPGYGGYDIYKTQEKDGKWTTPQNLGEPINSPGDDIFFVLEKNNKEGYYSSNRAGGFGDMDIYHVNYISTEIPECEPAKDSLMAIHYAKALDGNPGYYIALHMPEELYKNVKTFTWKINDSIMPYSASQFQQKFEDPGMYKLTAKVILACDTCPSALLAMCAETTITIEDFNYQSVTVNPEPQTTLTSLSSSDPYLNDDQLKTINWNTDPTFFDYDQASLRKDATNILDHNIEVMKKHSELVINIVGYTDSRGSSEYNMQLSARRVNAVREYLLKQGISKSRIISTNALGETQLVNNCTDNVECEEQQHQLNRKVKLNVMPAAPIKILTSIQE